MMFLAPWALAVGAAGAVGLVLLHLVAWQRPAAYVLPTTRFIPDQRTVVSRAATRPRDVLLLLLRVAMLLAAAVAFARPVVAPSKGSVAQVVLIDVSRSVADRRVSIAAARKVLASGRVSALIAFDSSARPVRVEQLDSLAASPASGATGSLSAALALARRSASDLAERSDSVELVVISPVMRGEIDSATSMIRSAWAGGVRVTRVSAVADTVQDWHLEQAIPLDDPLGPASLALSAHRSGTPVRLVRRALTNADSVFARNGGTLVHWGNEGVIAVKPEGLTTGDEVVVAMFGRSRIPKEGAAVAHWADAEAAARETSIGRGCIREVGVVVPPAGDLPLHAPFQRVVRRLLAPCAHREPDVLADTAVVLRLMGSAGAAPSSALRNHDAPATPLVKWLLTAALFLAVVELIVRTQMKPALPA